jgi:hypothetical protein
VSVAVWAGGSTGSDGCSAVPGASEVCVGCVAPRGTTIGAAGGLVLGPLLPRWVGRRARCQRICSDPFPCGLPPNRT